MRVPTIILATVAAIVAALGLVVWWGLPSFNDAMTLCLEQEKNQAPAHRTATCLCFVDEVRSIEWAIFKTTFPERIVRDSERVAINACRAKTFSVNMPSG